MPSPGAVDAYLDQIDQAIFEVDDLLACADDEGDPEDSAYTELLPLFQQLSQALRQLHAEVRQGTHVFGGTDLAFMAFVRSSKARIPFYGLLLALNDAHRKGL